MKIVKLASVLGSMAAGLMMSATAQAASIGISFGNGSTGSVLASGDSAGVVAQTNWNNLVGHATAIAASSLVDDSGTPTPVAASFYAAGGSPWVSINSFTAGTGDNKLMRGGLESYSYSTFPSKVENLTGITYGDYDVYVYFSAGDATSGVTGDVTPGATVSLAISGVGSGAGSFTYTPINNPGSYIAATGAGGAADYAVFHVTGALSTDTLTIKQGFASSYANKEVGLNAVQIVSAVPEPVALGLLAAALPLTLRRRR
jgi:hypothetical protein